MKRTGLILILVFAALANTFAQHIPRAKWKLLSIAGDTITYIQTKKVITRQGTVRVWVKLVRLAQDDIGSKNLDLQKYANSAHALVLWEFNCRDQTMKMVSLVNYSEKGDASNSEITNRNKWQPVPPDSAGEAMMNVACEKNPL